MFILNQPLPKAQSLLEAEPSMLSSTSKPNFTLCTSQRDLKLLTEHHLYYAEIEISGGANRVTTVDVEDFSLPAATIATNIAQLRSATPLCAQG